MALKDVKKYYYNVQAQLIAAKEDLEEFSAALQDGYITEDRLIPVLNDVENLQINYDRLSYIMYLFELPRKTKKQKKFKQANGAIEGLLETKNATESAVLDENKSMLDSIRKELKALKEEMADK